MTLLFQNNPYLQSCTAHVQAVREKEIRFDRTLFYPEGGGQPGDTGSLSFEDSTLSIIDTQKDHNGVFHIPQPDLSLPEIGSQVELRLDWRRRYRHMRMHTALHLLCSLISGSVTGGRINADKSRLDFNVPTESLDKSLLTEKLNHLVTADYPVFERWIEEKNLNPKLIRTMSVSPPTGTGWIRLIEIDTIDLQPCGGTHVLSTKEIGEVDVVKIENKGKQNRRVTIKLIAP